jgi:antitoxin (DNA-binding transcriptional repressor) of toxin-antitoxin stability system
MKKVNIHEAETHLSRWIEEAAKGESFIIAKAGKPLVKVSALGAPSGAEMQRLGFMAGQISVPGDFDQMGRELMSGFSAAAHEAAIGYESSALGGC